MKKWFWIALVILSTSLGVWLTYSLMSNKETIHSESDVNIVYEEIKKACKLVTVEGTYTERFDSLNQREFPILFPLPYSYKFPKEATIFVKGKVLVGYNMGEIAIKVDDFNKEIVLSNVPDPEIIAIDHDLTYENIEESWFNKFTAKDFTALNKSAKAAIRKSHAADSLLQLADLEGNQMIEIVRALADKYGYQLKIKDAREPLKG